MFLVMPDPPVVGTQVQLHFALPDGPPWEVTAQTTWVRPPEEPHPYPPGMGLQFGGLPAEVHQALADFVAARLAPPSVAAFAITQRIDIRRVRGERPAS